MRRLIISDSYDLSWLGVARAATRDGDSWAILPLGLSHRAYQHRTSEGLADLPGCVVLDLGEVAQEARQAVKDFVLEAFHRLPEQQMAGENLYDLLQTPEGNHWWFLRTSEKNPIRDPLIDQLYRLAVVRSMTEMCNYEEIWIAVDEAPLRDVLASSFGEANETRVLTSTRRQHKWWWDQFPLVRYWIHAIHTLVDYLLVRVFFSLPGWPHPKAMGGGVLFFTMYPYWWLSPYSQDSRERFFASPDKIPGGRYLTWFVWPEKLWRNRHQVRQAIRRHGLVPFQPYIGVFQACSLLSPLSFARTVRFHWRMRRELRVGFHGFEVGDLIAEDLSRSLTGSEFFMNVLLCKAARILGRTSDARAFVVRMEAQVDENALFMGVGRHIPTVGFLHSPVVDNALPLHFASGELAERLQGHPSTRVRPLPHGVLVCGTGWEKRLAAEGFPVDRIALCGPQRHQSLVDRLHAAGGRATARLELGLPAEVPIVVVAPALLENETEALFRALMDALADDVIEDLRVIVKSHPNKLASEDALGTAMLTMGPERASIMPHGADVYHYLAAADALVCIGSWIAFDAMAMGVMPIVFEDPATFAATSMASYEKGLFVVRDGEELRAALLDTMSASEEALRRRRAWSPMLVEVFGNLDLPLEEQLRDGLRALGVAPLDSGHR